MARQLASRKAKVAPAAAAPRPQDARRETSGSAAAPGHCGLGRRSGGGPDAAAQRSQEWESDRGSDLLNLIKCKCYKKFFKERKAEG